LDGDVNQIVMHTGLFVTLILSSSICYSQQMCEWVDKGGNVNYSKSPPPDNIEADTIKVSPKIDGSVSERNI